METAEAKELAEIRARWIRVRDAMTQFLILAPEMQKIAEHSDQWKGLAKAVAQLEKTAGVIDKNIAKLTQENKAAKPSGASRRRKPTVASRRAMGHKIRAQRV